MAGACSSPRCEGNCCLCPRVMLPRQYWSRLCYASSAEVHSCVQSSHHKPQHKRMLSAQHMMILGGPEGTLGSRQGHAYRTWSLCSVRGAVGIASSRHTTSNGKYHASRSSRVAHVARAGALCHWSHTSGSVDAHRKGAHVVAGNHLFCQILANAVCECAFEPVLQGGHLHMHQH